MGRRPEGTPQYLSVLLRWGILGFFSNLATKRSRFSRPFKRRSVFRVPGAPFVVESVIRDPCIFGVEDGVCWSLPCPRAEFRAAAGEGERRTAEHGAPEQSSTARTLTVK